MSTREHVVRAMWTLFEPIHAVSYFAEQARNSFAEVGLTRYWDGYFAGRAAPLGPIGAEPVTAIFSGFAPFLVERALPNVWSIASPEAVLDARSRGAASALRALIDDEDAVARAADVLATVAARVDTIGRPLAAANRALDKYEDPYRRLWQSTATLREHRGDGHVIALVTSGIAGITSVVLRSALDLDPDAVKRARGWSDDEWQSEVDALVGRGLLTPDFTVTVSGTEVITDAEHLTNRLALQPWDDLDDERLLEIARLLHPIARACTGLFPQPNPIGIPVPWDPTDPDAREVPASPVMRERGLSFKDAVTPKG